MIRILDSQVLNLSLILLVAIYPKLLAAEISALEGVWRGVKMYEEGQEVNLDSMALELTISGNNYLLRTGDTITELTIVDKTGNRFDLVPKGGLHVNKRFQAVYKVNDRSLKIAYGPSGGAAKGTFNSVGENGREIHWELIGKLIDESFTADFGTEFSRILPGTIILGANPEEPSRADEAQRRVTISRPYFIARTEVTVGLYEKFVNEKNYRISDGGISTIHAGVNAFDENASWKNPGFSQTKDHPVVFVSWNDAVAFCEWLSEKYQGVFRLPTEAEWEFAARARSRSAYYWGDDFSKAGGRENIADTSYAKSFPSRDFKTKIDDGYVYTAPVGSFLPNNNLLYDVHGNVIEWVSDYWQIPLYRSIVDPKGPATGKQRLAKGGGYASRPDHARAAFRFREIPSLRLGGIGFRLVYEP